MKRRYPVVVIIGRPNVGKSSLYNRLIGRREAIVDKVSGVTRDRQYYEIEHGGERFYLVDTGGVSEECGDILASQAMEESEKGMREGEVIIYMVEVGGLSRDDYELADRLRSFEERVIVVVNKCDHPELDQSSVIGHELGLGEPIGVSAVHGRNIQELLDRVVVKVKLSVSMRVWGVYGGKGEYKVGKGEDKGEDKGVGKIKVAIIGRPNVGKSSLMNGILKEERCMVSDIPGTTRDMIYEGGLRILGYEWDFIDTAGLRRRSKIKDAIEYYSTNRAVKAIERGNIVIHLIDSQENLRDQDKKIIRVAVDRGKGVIIGVNKWDLMGRRSFGEYEEELRHRFRIGGHIPVRKISALRGEGVKGLLERVIDMYKVYGLRLETQELNDFLQGIQKRNPSRSGGRGVKIYYGHQVGVKPPKFVIFVNDCGKMRKNDQDYIINQLRHRFGFMGVPIKLYFRKSE